MSAAIRLTAIVGIFFTLAYNDFAKGITLIRDPSSISHNAVCTLRQYGTEVYLTAHNESRYDQNMIILTTSTTRNDTAAQWIVEKVPDTEMFQMRNQKYFDRGNFSPHIPRNGLYTCVFSTIDDCENSIANQCLQPPHFTLYNGTQENTVIVAYFNSYGYDYNLTTTAPDILRPGIWGAHCATISPIFNLNYDWIMEC